VPEFDIDMIIFAGDRYKILRPPLGFREGASEVLYYDCNVNYFEKVT
jgi:hypothetical protein